MPFRLLRRSLPRWQRLSPAGDLRLPQTHDIQDPLHFPAAAANTIRDPSDRVISSDVEADTLRWIHDLVRRHAPAFELRDLPRGSNVSFLVRQRNQPQDSWAGIILRSSLGPHRSSVDPNLFEFAPAKRSMKTDTCVLMLACAPAGFVWLFEPASTMPRRVYGISPCDKYKDELVDPPKLEERFGDLIANPSVTKTGLPNWLVLSAPTESTLRLRQLLRQLICLRPFENLHFVRDQRAAFNAILNERRIVVRGTTPTKKAVNGGLSSFSRDLWPPVPGKSLKIPFDVTDGFEHALILVSDVLHPKQLARLGILRKSVLVAHGYVSDRASGVPGRCNIFVRWDGNFAGSALAGLEDSFIDVRTASVEELQDFVQRQLSES